MASFISKLPFRDDARLMTFHQFAKSEISVKVVRDDSAAPCSSKSSGICQLSAKIARQHQHSYQSDILEVLIRPTEICRSLDLRVLLNLPKFHGFRLTTESSISQGIKGCISDEVSGKHGDARLCLKLLGGQRLTPPPKGALDRVQKPCFCSALVPAAVAAKGRVLRSAGRRQNGKDASEELTFNRPGRCNRTVCFRIA